MRSEFTITLAQARALAALVPRVADGFLHGTEPLTDELLTGMRLSGWHGDRGELDVLLQPAQELVTLDVGGREVARRLATRAETLTLALRVDPLWAPLRALLAARKVDPAQAVVGDALDDDDEHELVLLVTRRRRVIVLSRRHDPTALESAGTIESWDDISGALADRPEWQRAAAEALALHDRLHPGG